MRFLVWIQKSVNSTQWNVNTFKTDVDHLRYKRKNEIKNIKCSSVVKFKTTLNDFCSVKGC